MNASHIDALSAMFDGESVDPAILREALTDPAAPDWLVEFAAWRAELRQDPSRPSDEFYRAMEPIVRPSRLRRLFGGPRLHLPAAAALALVAAAIGFAIRPAVERPTPPLLAVHGGGPTASPRSVPAAGQPSVQSRTSEAADHLRNHGFVYESTRGWRVMIG
jgi:hypothetical protein